MRIELNFVDVGGNGHIVDESLTLENRPDVAHFRFEGCMPHFDGLGDVCWTYTSTGRAAYATKSWPPVPLVP